MGLYGFWNKYNPGCRLRPYGSGNRDFNSDRGGCDAADDRCVCDGKRRICSRSGNQPQLPFQCGETLGFIRGTGQTGADGLRGSEAAKRQSGSCNLRREHDFREQRPLYCTDWNYSGRLSHDCRSGKSVTDREPLQSADHSVICP